MKNEVIFTAIIEREILNNPNFKIYAVNPTSNKDNLKFNKYNNVSISGDLPKLSLGIEYYIKGIENKWGYTVINIKRDKPTTKKATEKFLQEVITKKQTTTLLNVYPDIVDRIINNNLDDIDLNKTKGIKEKTFDIIKNKIIEAFPLVEFIERFSHYNITLTEAKKMYEHFTSIERMEELIINEPYKTLCSISGISFKKADAKILSNENEKLKNSLQRMKACLEFCLHENESKGNTWISLEELLKMCNELVPECIEDYFIKALQDSNLHIDQKNKRISFLKTYQTEEYIANCMLSLLKNSTNLLIDYTKYNRINGINLTEEQLNTLKNLCKYNISLLIGNAGSGKSQTVAAVIEMCDDNNLQYVLMTPTGKSAQVLSNFTNRDAGTIHRKLDFNPVEGWGYNEKNKLDCDIVIIDENGMTDIFLMKHLLEAIDLTHTKLLFVQDDAQLPSVSCGNCAYDMINSNIIPYTRLNKIFRYGEGGLLQIATKIRQGEKYIDNKSTSDIKSFGTNGDYCVIPTANEYMLDYIIGIYKSILKQGYKPLDIMILSAKNINTNGSIEINEKIQEEINPHDNDKRFIKYGNRIFRENDIVMQIKNNYQAINEYGEIIQITNGDVGQIKKINCNHICVQYKNNMVLYEKDNLDELQLAYSMSIHKSQGSSIPYVILVTPTSHKFNLNKNLLYVGVTRARRKCFHITLPETINAALRKSAELQRNTFLKDLLINEYDNLKIIRM